MEVGENVGENVEENLTLIQREVLKKIMQNKRVSQRELSEYIGVTPTHIYRIIFELRKRGIIRRIGPDKGGHWEIIKKQNWGGK